MNLMKTQKTMKLDIWLFLHAWSKKDPTISRNLGSFSSDYSTTTEKVLAGLKANWEFLVITLEKALDNIKFLYRYYYLY